MSVVHFNVTSSPTARWAAQQIVEAFPFEEVPRFLLRDRDGIYGQDFRDRVKHMGIEEVLIAFRSPWQSLYVERLIGSIRRECLDHVIVFGEEHICGGFWPRRRPSRRRPPFQTARFLTLSERR